MTLKKLVRNYQLLINKKPQEIYMAKIKEFIKTLDYAIEVTKKSDRICKVSVPYKIKL